MTRICGFVCKNDVVCDMMCYNQKLYNMIIGKVDTHDMRIAYNERDEEIYTYAWTIDSDIELFLDTYQDYLSKNCPPDDYRIFELDRTGIFHVNGSLECNSCIKFFNDKYITCPQSEETICKECNGKGILDFGFYTRKCMKCCEG